ncbi:HEAT repeat domain-containing protein [Mesorhizobium sp. YIM 152430]|uniref:HEAT repeat domain-containing protein n=1 Tax=Mesorhizobium sp. YIM 152430 TaxID=3031761 RepID=UPI0023DAE358|nr:HEAT repeat domain-containing protein [Mesorhizobium sp. YIM 152430]MDF1600820.1 HEAT repeat domain-containing protein [Mesorhizobium sp. YIM 152430]
MLVLIWTLSLILSAISILVMVILVLRRVVAARREERDAESRRRIMTAMICLAHDKDVDAFLAVAAQASTSVTADASSEFLGLVRGEEREAVLQALLRAGQPDFLERELKRGDEVRRLHAVELIAAYAPDVAIGPLRGRLEGDRSREVRIAAAIELAKIGTVPPLGELLDRIGYRGQRSRRLAELFGLLPEQSAAELRDLTRQRDAPGFLRASALEALWRRDGLVEPSIFVEAAEDSVPEVAAASLRALGRIGQRTSLPLLLSKLYHPDWEVRMEAVEAVGRLGDPDAAKAVTDLLDDEQWTVRYKAAQSLLRLGPVGEATLRTVALEGTARKQRTASLVLSEGMPA